MEITKLPRGDEEPADTDCIKINKNAAGEYMLVASALAAGADGDPEIPVPNPSRDLARPLLAPIRWIDVATQTGLHSVDPAPWSCSTICR
jgi:hypothetical protein